MKAMASARVSKWTSVSPSGGSDASSATSLDVVTDSIRYEMSMETGNFKTPAATSPSSRIERGSHTSKSQSP